MAGPRRSRGNCIREFSARSNSIKKRNGCAFFHTKLLDVRCALPEEGSFRPAASVKRTCGHLKGGSSKWKIFTAQFKPESSVLPVTKAHCDVYMGAENDFQTPMETDNETAAFASRLVESYELSQKSGTTAETKWPQMLECPSAMEIEPSGSEEFLENS